MINFANDPIEIKTLRKTMKTLITKTTDQKKLIEATKQCAKKILKDKCTYEIDVIDDKLTVDMHNGCAIYRMIEQIGETTHA